MYKRLSELADVCGIKGNSEKEKAEKFIYKSENIETLKKLTKRMHEMETPIIAQLNHCGGQSKEESAHMPIVAPSKISDYKAREMTKGEILEGIEMFVQGTKNAKEAGFDGVQIHLAHGYLLSEFVSPRMNRRKDEWGGSTENRFRIVKLMQPCQSRKL